MRTIVGLQSEWPGERAINPPKLYYGNSAKSMGKRELVLIALFAAIGVVVYQFTAPPPPPGSDGVSVGGIFQKLKRGVHGSREEATADFRQSLAVDATVRLIRINFPRATDVTITGS